LGSATLGWPFEFLNPDFFGMTENGTGTNAAAESLPELTAS